MKINAGTALAAHIACGTADVTIIVGILCHGSVALVHSAADDNALLDKQDCIKDCKDK